VLCILFRCDVESSQACSSLRFRAAKGCPPGDNRTAPTGHSHSFGGTYLELVPGERLVYTDKFDDPNLPGEMKITATLKAVSVGTEVNIEQQGVPDVIPVEACYLGWQESLRKLSRLVEPEINQ